MKREMQLDPGVSGLQAPEHEMWLLGQAPLRKYLEFVEDQGFGPRVANRVPLVQEWSMAAAWYEKLAQREPNTADDLECLPLGAEMAPLAEAVLDSPRFRCTFDHLPTHIAMVELARLVVCQNHVTRTFVDRLKERLGPDPDPVSLFHFCLPLTGATGTATMRAIGSRRFEFRSPSTDFRFHNPVFLKPEHLDDYASFGAVTGALGLFVGYSSNLLNAILDDDRGRLVLNNGYHRACALLELGVTHAPCVIQTVTSRDELDLAAKPIVANDPGYFFNGARPPLLKDFKDPHIRKILPTRRITRVIEVSFDVHEYTMDE